MDRKKRKKPKPRRVLATLMSAISERCYCAGWDFDTEYDLWKLVVDPEASRRHGGDRVTEKEVETLRALSVEVGGWIRWRDDPDLPASAHGLVFTPMDEWLKIYERHLDEESGNPPAT